jgi:hypothetical protein
MVLSAQENIMALRLPSIVLAAVVVIAPAAGQSLNVEFGDGASAPPASYAAAGLAGVWNSLEGVELVTYPLVDLNGAAIPATLKNIGAPSSLQVNDPLTFGADEALMDEMIISFNNPVDACIFFSGLAPGEYDVLVYAMTPGNAGLQSRVRVDFANEPPIWIGGAWPGQQQEGITYAHHTVTVTNGSMGLHSGDWGTLVQSGINGIQLMLRTDVDCPSDLDGDGQVGLGDLGILLASFGINSGGDVDGDNDTDLGDLGVLLAVFGDPCP